MAQAEPMLGDVQLGEIMRQLSERLPADAIITNGAGNYATWLHRHYSYRHFRSQVAPTSGAMGYGVPAAIAAKSLYPERTVVAFAGDGCFMMSSQELATAMQYALHGDFHRREQRAVRHDPHASGAALSEPRAWHRAHESRLRGFRAVVRRAWRDSSRRPTDFMPAFERAVESGLPAVIEIRIPQEESTPGATLDQIREQGRKQG